MVAATLSTPPPAAPGPIELDEHDGFDRRAFIHFTYRLARGERPNNFDLECRRVLVWPIAPEDGAPIGYVVCIEGTPAPVTVLIEHRERYRAILAGRRVATRKRGHPHYKTLIEFLEKAGLDVDFC